MSTLALKNRRSLTPTAGIPTDPSVHQMRRAGPRREVSERIAVKRTDESVLSGWALNISRGGLRAILETHLDLGEEIEVTVGEEDTEKSKLTRRGRIVWIQEESDGVVVGVEFMGTSGTHRSAPPAPPSRTE